MEDSTSVGYSFSDASGKGVSSGMAAKELRLHYSHWCSWVGEKSSNYRELQNLVEAIEIKWREGRLWDMNSSCSLITLWLSKHIMLGLPQAGICLQGKNGGGLILHIVHVSGKQMIKSGIDGLSRGDTYEGVAAGMALLSYVDLQQFPLERSPLLESWFWSWWRKEELGGLSFLTPEGWFIHDKEGEKENCAWAPPPAAAEMAIEEMATCFHKEP